MLSTLYNKQIKHIQGLHQIYRNELYYGGKINHVIYRTNDPELSLEVHGMISIAEHQLCVLEQVLQYNHQQKINETIAKQVEEYDYTRTNSMSEADQYFFRRLHCYQEFLNYFSTCIQSVIGNSGSK